MEQEEERRLWQLYTACLGNALVRPGSFDAFRRKYGAVRHPTPGSTPLPRAQAARQLAQARAVLADFVPPNGAEP